MSQKTFRTTNPSTKRLCSEFATFETSRSMQTMAALPKMTSGNTDEFSVGSFESYGDQSKTSTTYGSSLGGSNTDALDHVKLLRKDSWIQSLRFLSLCILLVVAYVVAMTVYVSLKGSEYREFENQFDSQAEQIGEGLQAELLIKLKSMESLSVAVTSYAESQPGMNWPNVTLPRFSYRSAGTLTIGGGSSVGLQPLVWRDQRNGWEAFSVQNQGWRDESIAFQEKHGDIFEIDTGSSTKVNAAVYKRNVSESIFQVDDAGMPIIVEGDLMIPVWQYSPIKPGLPYVNYDQHAKQRNREALNEVVDSEVAVLGKFFELSESFQGYVYCVLSEHGF